MKNKAEDFKYISSVVLFDDKQAFEFLVKKHQSSIRRFLSNLTMGNKSLSDDLAQETFIKAYLNINKFNGLSSFSTWLTRIAYNVYYDSKRTQKYWEDLNVEKIDNQFQSPNSFSFEKEDFHKALSLLRKEERTALLLFYMEDRTQKEVARIMNCPLGTVKTYILKGKERLLTFLSKNGYGSNG